LKLSYFLSSRVSAAEGGEFSSLIHRIAVATIAIGLAAAIVSFLILNGFRETVMNKIFNFSSNLLITKYTLNNSTGEEPFFTNLPSLRVVSEIPGVGHMQEYSHKAGLIRTDDEVLGAIFKGVGAGFDQGRFSESLVEGSFISFPDSSYSREIIISRTIARKIKAGVGDDVIMHFFQNPPRVRRLTVTGVYETNLSEYFDNKVIIGDIRMIRGLNEWADSVAGGVEVFVDYDQYDRMALFRDKMQAIAESDLTFWEKLTEWSLSITGFDFEHEARMRAADNISLTIDYDLFVETADEKYVQVFEWLQLIGRQVNILLVIILSVVCVNMISVILILVMERTQMIGMLKALGARDSLIRSVFLIQGFNLAAKGLLFGNTLGLGLCWIQDRFKVIALNPNDYYMSFVPVSWHWEVVVVLNLLVLGVVAVVLFVPAMAITRISPVKAIRFD
jgi:lipoprotein-releasing system permease protein